MQFVKGGPDIPERLLEAHEDGQVAFFSGAGISYPAGLPGFGRLVAKLYEKLKDPPNPLQRAAIRGKRFDTAIALLERDVAGGRQTVRKEVAKILTPDLDAPGCDRHPRSTAEARQGPRRAHATDHNELRSCVRSRDQDEFVARETLRGAAANLETQGCDYVAWRLFLLSLLWKMDRSRLGELASVDLGDARDEIHEMIASGDPGAPMDYPCWIYILALSGQPMREFMSTPLRFEYKGYPVIELTFGGLGWFFIIGRNVACDTMRRLVLDRTGRMRLLFREAESMRWLVEGVARIEEMGNWTEGAERRSGA